MALADVDLRRLINARAARPGSPCRAEPLPRDISAAAEAVGIIKFVGKRIAQGNVAGVGRSGDAAGRTQKGTAG